MGRLGLLREILRGIRFAAFSMCPEAILKMQFRRHVGYDLNLRNPQTFNEKIRWLKLYWYDRSTTTCADKYAVREYVKSKGLEHLLNELYAVYDHVHDIEFDRLPDKFVMKTTHGSGQNVICTNKSMLNWEVERQRLEKWLSKSFYVASLEWVYRDIKPRIIVEKLIETTDGKPPEDYKIFCFNGEPTCLFVATDRGKYTTRFDFYDLEWNRIPVRNHYPNSEEILPRPPELEAMIEYARILSEEFPHVRVDFYVEEGRVIFGECTFFHFSGLRPFEPVDFDYEMGGYLTLPQ